MSSRTVQFAPSDVKSNSAIRSKYGAKSVEVEQCNAPSDVKSNSAIRSMHGAKSVPKVRLKRKKEEVGCVEDKQRMDAVKEKAIEAIMRYCDSLYFKENTIEEKLNGIQGPRVPSKYEFESLIGFIEMVSEREIIDEYKELVKNHFGRMVQWFHKDYMEGEERPIPARINGVKVSLLDLYLTVKGLGGHTQVIMKNNWIEVAYAMGFPKEYVSELEECYGTHLSLLGAYYEGARNYSSGMDVPKAREREGTSGIMAMELPSEETRQGHIGTKARLVDDEEGMIGKVELDDGENATNKKIKKEDELKTLPSITLGGLIMNRSWKPDLCNDSTVASEPKVRLKRRKEEVGCVEDKQRMDAVKEKAIEAIMRLPEVPFDLFSSECVESAHILFNHSACVAAAVAAMNSDSQDDKATVACFCVLQLIGDSP
ncbi:ARID DNA-binding domain-containing protein [Tanacetum coccineum]|uniref:ARID DNA-binding domain-containing protein n=1 Tax=Tanacetum coccineum TaxID=301880 RepID=A0ABQ5ARX5_9ASTR